METPQNGERRILLGQIVRAQGIRGEVVVRTFTGNPEDIASYGPLSDADGKAPLTLSVVRVSDKGVVVRIQGVGDRNGAEALRGRELYVARSRLPEADESAFYYADLIGLEAVAADGSRLGHVAGIQNFGAGDLLEIAREGAKETELVPFTDACVPNVDLERGRVTIIPPEMTGEPEPASGSDDGDESGDGGAETAG